jgi:hypothetical protein
MRSRDSSNVLQSVRNETSELKKRSRGTQLAQVLASNSESSILFSRRVGTNTVLELKVGFFIREYAIIQEARDYFISVSHQSVSIILQPLVRAWVFKLFGISLCIGIQRWCFLSI